jgi:hypothetical protein
VSRPNPIILPENVHLDFVAMPPLNGTAGLQRAPDADHDKPDVAKYEFGGPHVLAMTALADIQVGLLASSDRTLCDLQLMQFVIPREFEVIYAGMRGGHSRYFYESDILNKVFLDGHIMAGVTEHANDPWMSLQSADKFAPNTRDGHFKNQSVDSPRGQHPTWVVVSHEDPSFNGEKHFLWRIRRREEFMTFAVFKHPSGKRQPLALVKWTCRHEYRLLWRQLGRATSIPNVRSGSSAIRKDGDVTTNAKDLAAHAGIIDSPPEWIHRNANPQLIEIFAAFGAKGLGHQHSPLNHPEIESDFFVTQ